MAKIEHSTEINASPELVYERLSHFDDYPRFMLDVRQVRRTGALRLQWQTGHGEHARSWEAEITQQIPARRIAWRHVHGPRYEASVELQPVQEDDAAVRRTRTTLRIECDPQEQILAGHGDALETLRVRAEQDLARFKKHVEQHDPAGIHVSVSASASAASATGSGPDIGKTVGQTAAERAETAGSSASGSNGGSSAYATASGAGSGVHLRHDYSNAHTEAHRATEAGQRASPWLRAAPGLPELWNLWQQPWRMMRRVSHDMERVLDTMRALRPGADRPGADRSSDPAPTGSGWTPAVETAQRDDSFIVCAELPGVKSDQLRVEIKHDRLTIEGDRHPEPRHAPQEQRRSERCYGHFYRVIALPPGAQPEDASAAMHDGVLEITVPLAAYAHQARRLDVRQE